MALERLTVAQPRVRPRAPDIQWGVGMHRPFRSRDPLPLVALVLAATVAPVRADLNVTEYHLRARLDLSRSGLLAPLNSMSATARVTVRNDGGAPASHLPVILNRMMKVEAVRAESGEELGFEQRLVAVEHWDTYHAIAADVRLDRPLPPDGVATVEIEYGGTLADYQDSGMLYVQDALDPEFTILRPEAAPFPLVAEPTRAGLRGVLANALPFDQVLEIDVPEGLTVATGLELVERREEGDRWSWVYRTRNPRPHIILPIAPYETKRAGVVTIYHFPDDREGASRVADGITSAMDLFERWFGPMRSSEPFSVVEIPEWHGSQALRPTILQEATAFRSADGMVELYHEISHLWNVADPSPAPARWNEGLATYLQYLVAQELDGDAEALDEGLEWLRKSLRRDLEENDAHRGVPLTEAGARNLTSELAYTGGGLFFGMLHHRLGQSRLLAVLRDFYQEHHSTGATSERFAEFLTSRAPASRQIVDDWFRGAAYADLVLESGAVIDLIERYEVN